VETFEELLVGFGLYEFGQESATLLAPVLTGPLEELELVFVKFEFFDEEFAVRANGLNWFHLLFSLEEAEDEEEIEGQGDGQEY